MIEIRQVSKSFDNSEILKDISYCFDGKMYSITGKSGSGKSTILYILGGLIKPDCGSVLLDGVDISALSDDESAMIRNKDIGFVFQSFFLELEFSVYENIELPLIIAKKKNYEEQIKNLLDKFDLMNLKNHKVINLSGGEKQRVAIARALVNNPRVLLCDEPTGNLDKANGDIVFGYLREIADTGVLVIFVTHDNEYTRIADVTLHLESGVLSEIN